MLCPSPADKGTMSTSTIHPHSREAAEILATYPTTKALLTLTSERRIHERIADRFRSQAESARRSGKGGLAVALAERAGLADRQAERLGDKRSALLSQ